jgi:hypothetical protein
MLMLFFGHGLFEYLDFLLNPTSFCFVSRDENFTVVFLSDCAMI